MNDHEYTNTHEAELPTAERPRIWVGSLADYNAGRLHGDWLDAATSHQELLEGVQRMLASSVEPGAEEWGIFDFDNFGPFRVGEYEDLSVVATVARGITQHGEAFAIWAELHDADEAMLNEFDDAYLGHYDSPEAFADQIIDDFGVADAIDNLAVPDWLRSHISIDNRAVAHDLQLGGDVVIEPGQQGVHVFRVR